VPLGLPQFIPLVGAVGISGLGVAALAGLLAGWGLLALTLRGAPSGLRAAVAALAGPLLVGALCGARLGNQLQAPDLRWSQPFTWLAITGTSLSFTGGLVGAAASAWLGARPLPAAVRWAALDALAPGACLAVALGWLGLPAPGRLGGFPVGPVGVQPVQLYALLGFAALAAALCWQWGRRDYPGQNAAAFVVLASTFRFVLAFGEQSTPVLGPWSLTQLGDGGAALAGLVLTAWLAARGARLS